jgi:hypothetical protein
MEKIFNPLLSVSVTILATSITGIILCFYFIFRNVNKVDFPNEGDVRVKPFNDIGIGEKEILKKGHIYVQWQTFKSGQWVDNENYNEAV